ncbi:hypothetical protein Q31b_30280 [Novipirellula aureliae]|uniref:Tll0287-like domain-containing protein n=2 Tax=Novipirellula aureliae TaxID=2527966 RepID=A0A5C6E0U8_9BACT|nr:hypothetical protein Q31b_30280 [Novipirellula aureliae]
MEPIADAEAAVRIVPGTEPSDQQRSAIVAAKDALFQRLSERLMEAMMTQGPAQAIAVCQKEATQIANEVGDEHKLSIGRLGVRLRNPENTGPAWAAALIEAKSETPVFTTLSNGNAAALLPIKLQSQCLMCHGPSEQISPDIQSQLAELYPGDQAVGFNEGELRGWFWVETPQS